MQTETHLTQVLAAPATRLRAPVAAIVIVVLVWVLAVYGETTYAMMSIWQRSETFAHGFVVIPVFLFLLWRQRAELAALEPRRHLAVLALLPVLGIVWLLAVQLHVNSVAQFAVIAMIPAGLWSVLGTSALRTLAFPLAFLFFAVPLGEFMLPVLMDWTADVTVFAIRASGVPVYREGNYFMIPSGKWSVVEACSGLRYLIASLMVGCLYAYLFYRTAARRAAFVALSLVVPIVANWIRAYMIVMLGHVSGNKIAVGVDHLVYGWIFFGVVMTVLFWLGARWRDDEDPRAVAPAGLVGGTSDRPRPGAKQWPALAGVLALTAVFPLLEAQFGGQGKSAVVALEPIAGRHGWTARPTVLSAWRPDLVTPDAELSQAFDRDGTSVGLYIALYGGATPESKGTTSTNQLVRTDNKEWRQIASGKAATVIEGRPWQARSGIVVRDRNGERYAVWQWYWVDGRVTTSDTMAKLYEVLAWVQGHGNPVAWVIVYTPATNGLERVRPLLQAFTAAMHEPIDAALKMAAGRR
jgi:exosortase A